MFAVGQEIICITKKWTPCPNGDFTTEGVFYPQNGETYHCGGYINNEACGIPSDKQFIRLREAPPDTFYASEGFRPVQKKEYSIEIFNEILNNAPKKKTLEEV